MSNPFSPDTPQGDPSDPEQPGTTPNYEAYRYPSGGTDATRPGEPAGSVPADDYSGYSGYSGAAGSTWAVNEEKNGVSPWALGLGILAFVMGLSILATGFAFLVGLIGLVVAVVALLRGRRINGPGRRTGMAVGGLVMSIIAIGLSIIFWVVLGVMIANTGMADCVDITDPLERQDCVERSIDTWLNQ